MSQPSKLDDIIEKLEKLIVSIDSQLLLLQPYKVQLNQQLEEAKRLENDDQTKHQ